MVLRVCRVADACSGCAGVTAMDWQKAVQRGEGSQGPMESEDAGGQEGKRLGLENDAGYFFGRTTDAHLSHLSRTLFQLELWIVRSETKTCSPKVTWPLHLDCIP